MTKPELLALFRIMADDATEPYQSSDQAVNLYITEAEREAAERALYFHTDASHNITVVAGTASYTLNEQIIFVNSAKLFGMKKPLKQTTRAKLNYYMADWESRAGTPQYWFIENNELRLCPIPDASFTLLIDGSRRPKADMEAPVNLQESLLYWVLYRHYSPPNADVVNPALAMQNLKAFNAVFGHKRTAAFDTSWRNGEQRDSFSYNPF